MRMAWLWLWLSSWLLSSSAARAVEPFAPVDLVVDLSSLPPGEQKALAKIVEASRLMDTLFLQQVWAGNEPMLYELARTASPRLHAFVVNKGPWDRLDHNRAFVPGAPPKPPQGNFYPLDATKAEVERWMKSLAPKERAQAEGFYTNVVRATDGKLMALPYSIAFANELGMAARLLDEAAELTAQPTLRDFLHKRAAAFRTNDYYDSDVAWMKLDATIEPTIGPYETYEDEWFSDKAAFEAFVTIRDEAESKKLARFAGELQDIENHLPIDARLRNPKLGALAPIRVVDEIFCAGDANHGVQTAAFNLPNDERVTRELGSKRVMLKNVQEAKFKMVLVPIARVALAPAEQKAVAFDTFFTHILMHELMHGLGPHDIVVAGQKTTARQALQETGSAIEEAKADVSGLWALQFLVDKGVIDKSMERTLYTTNLAELFRAIRFGVTEAHGKGTALQLNTYLDAGAIVVRNGQFTVDAPKFRAAVEKLAHDLLMLEANGDLAGARAQLEKMAVVRPEVQRVLDKLGKVPVDIEPRFVTAEKLLKR